MTSFYIALQFLTRLPAPEVKQCNDRQIGRSVAFYPVVGLIIGAWLVLVAQLVQWLPDTIVAAMVLAVWCWLTGALHLDGVADTADGWLGALNNPQRALDIMKDSHIGTGGAVAVVLLLLAKWSVLVTLLEQQAFLIILLAPFLARIAVQLLMASTHYVTPHGIAETLVANLPRKAIALWLLVLVLVTIWIAWPLLVAVTLAIVWVRWLSIRITGGMTGDTAGTVIEVTELFVLLAMVFWLA